MPWWDALRGDPRFEKIVASLAPSNILSVWEVERRSLLISLLKQPNMAALQSRFVNVPA